jgi:hypothetical protein
MNRTAKQIQQDFYRLLRTSNLAAEVTGDVYIGSDYGSNRPHGSQLEDIIVINPASDAEEIQSGIITINIYVPDIATPASNGLVENQSRCAELEIAANVWLDEIVGTTEYRLRLAQAVSTNYHAEINQHFVVLKIRFDVLTN